MQLVDTHAHLDDEQLVGDLDEVLARAREAGVACVVSVATTAESSLQTVALTGRYADVFATVGIQPNYVAQSNEGDWERVVQLAGSPGVVGVGETGLDRYWDYTPFEEQQASFGRHIELAQGRDLPLVIHCRDAEADVVAALRHYAARGRLRGVMHSFTGGEETAAACLELGLYISFAGMVTFKKSESLRRVAAGVPTDRLLLETDSPYLSPEPFRGRRNEPARLVHTASRLAEVRGVSVEELARQTTENARRLFGLPISQAG
jgi:TatD DNase family protein